MFKLLWLKIKGTTPLEKCINSLAKQVREEFDLTFSVHKMRSDKNFRRTLTHELRTLGDDSINTKLDLITRLSMDVRNNKNDVLIYDSERNKVIS